MEKQMAQCEDGRRRQARIQGFLREEGGFKIWKAGVRLKGKHIYGEAWYSYQTKTWYFLSDPEGKHSHLMERIKNTLREEKINKLREQLKMLESQYAIKQREIAEQRNAMQTIESKIAAVKKDMAKLEKGVPVESENALAYSRHIKRN